MEALESISVGTLNLLEAIRTNQKHIKLFSAGSSECFGNTELEGADEVIFFCDRAVPMRSLRQRPSGRWRITGAHMEFTRARKDFSTTSRP